MSLLEPNAGLVFWMLIAFGIVFFILAKFGWPVITNAAEKRSNFISESMKSAKEANRQLTEIKVEAENIIADAKNQRAVIMKESAVSRDKIIADAQLKASSEAQKIIADAQVNIQKQKDEVMTNYRSDVADAALVIAEKILRKELSKDEQQIALINKFLDEMKN